MRPPVRAGTALIELSCSGPSRPTVRVLNPARELEGPSSLISGRVLPGCECGQSQWTRLRLGSGCGKCLAVGQGRSCGPERHSRHGDDSDLLTPASDSESRRGSWTRTGGSFRGRGRVSPISTLTRTGQSRSQSGDASAAGPPLRHRHQGGPRAEPIRLRGQHPARPPRRRASARCRLAARPAVNSRRPPPLTVLRYPIPSQGRERWRGRSDSEGPGCPLTLSQWHPGARRGLAVQA